MGHRTGPSTTGMQTSPPTDPSTGARRCSPRASALGLWHPPRRQQLSHPGSNNTPSHCGTPAPGTTLSISLSHSQEHWEPSGLTLVPSSSLWRWVPPKLGRDSSAAAPCPRPRQPARPGSVCHSTAAPIRSSCPLRTPLAAHLPSHMAEEEGKQSRRRRRPSPPIPAPWAHSPASCRAGQCTPHCPDPQLPLPLHAPELPPTSLSYLFSLYFPLLMLSSQHTLLLGALQPHFASQGHSPNPPTATPSPIYPPRQLSRVSSHHLCS